MRIFQCDSAMQAKGYYVSGLEDASDYYLDGVAASGYWRGRGAEMLGLSGDVTKEEFDSLCDNRRPDTGGKLNPRENEKRKIGYDIVFSAPKSVSLVQGIVGDARVVKVFQQSVRETMALMEEDIHVRVRRGGAVETRMTSNIVYGEFTHYESRPIEGLSDPNLHCHCYTFNSSWDSVEGRFKAGEFFQIKKDAPYYEAIFHSKLAMSLKGLGYAIENKPYSFEIAGVGQANLDRFSRRTAEIEELAERLGISGNYKAMDKLGALNRNSKKHRLKGRARVAEWRARLDWGLLDLKRVVTSVVDTAKAMTLSIANSLERRSVISWRRLVADALQNSLGDCSFEEIESALGEDDRLIVVERSGEDMVTTKEILAEEEEILSFLQRTRGDRFPIRPGYKVLDEGLDSGQRNAIEILLNSTGRVVVLEGKAGTGKTTLMTSAVRSMKDVGEVVFVFAPTSEATDVLRQEGFGNAETIQRFLIDEKLQANARHSILWVDEAGLLSVPEMGRLFRIAEQQGARVVLSGDVAQHHSVERGDALRLCMGSGHVQVGATRVIYRQRREQYREAVEAISRGDVEAGFLKLDELGAIREIPDLGERLKTQAKDHVDAMKGKGSVLAVSPTHLEGKMMTRAIRSLLREEGSIAEEEREVPVHRNRNLTAGQRALPHHLQEGDIVRFFRHAPGIRAGSAFRIYAIPSGEVLMQELVGSGEVVLELNYSDRFQVYEERSLKVSVGDKVRVIRNASSVNGKRLLNGSVHELTSVTKAGELVLSDKYIVDPQEGFLDFGYVTTSHASQGKTAGRVLIGQSSLSNGGASMEQFYVSVSRGRDEVAIYTDCKASLFEQICGEGRRELAIELKRQAERNREEDLELVEIESEELALLGGAIFGEER